jgi:hypothetical protein
VTVNGSNARSEHRGLRAAALRVGIAPSSVAQAARQPLAGAAGHSRAYGSRIPLEARIRVQSLWPVRLPPAWQACRRLQVAFVVAFDAPFAQQGQQGSQSSQLPECKRRSRHRRAIVADHAHTHKACLADARSSESRLRCRFSASATIADAGPRAAAGIGPGRC